MNQPDFNAEKVLQTGISHHQAGRLEEAEQLYRQILGNHPEHADAHHLLGGIAYKKGDLEEAIELISKAIEIAPGEAVYYSNLGNALNDQGRTDEAVEHCNKALELNPDLAGAHNNLGNALKGLGQLDEAIECYKKCVSLQPNNAMALNNMGTALQDQSRLDEAIECFSKALEINPDYADALNNLGVVFKNRGQLDKAAEYFQKAIGVKPDFAVANNNLGNVLLDQGRADEALRCFNKALNITPDDDEVHSNMLMSMHYCPGVTTAQLVEPHSEWNERFGVPLRKQWRLHDTLRDPEKRMRIGLVSPNFDRHPVSYFLVRLLENKHQDEVEFFCYSECKPDEMTERMKAASDSWVDIRAMSDNDLAERIRADSIDILFDLTGHTASNRLLTFARKPAPVQVSWGGIGYPGSTGLTAIDYLLADIHHAPMDEDHLYQEKIIRLPDSIACYDPPSYAPTVGPLPAEQNGFITFGSFNNPAKINSEVMEVWMEILKAIPGSRLLLKYKGIDDVSNQERFLSPLEAHGLDASRLILEGRSLHKDMLTRYNEVDLALDTFPYSGGLTTCEALWMGVPVITFPGKAAAGRHSLSYLSVVGLSEMVTKDKADYVKRAVERVGDLPQLASLRSGLRDRVAQSPLCDGARFAANFTSAMRKEMVG